MVGEPTGETPKTPEPVTKEPQKPGIPGLNPPEVSREGGYSFSLEGRGRVLKPEPTTQDVLVSMRTGLREALEKGDEVKAAAIRRNIAALTKKEGL